MRVKIFTSIITLLLSLPVLSLAQQGPPLTLEDCIEIGLEHNQTLRINRFDTDRSVSQAKSNIAMVLPQVNFSLGSNYSGKPTPETILGLDTLPTISHGDVIFPSFNATGEYGERDWNDSYSMSLNLTQNIWDGGVWWNSLKSAKVALDAADIQNTGYEVATIYQIKIAFYNYLSTKKLLDVYKDNLNTSEYQHQLTLERFKLGAASQNDTLRTRVNIEKSRLQIINGEADLGSKARDMNLILGREWHSPVTLQEPTWEAVNVPSMESVVDAMLSSNTQLQLLERNKTVSEYNVKIAKAGYVPSLGLNASYSNAAFDLGDVFSSNTSNLSTGLSLSWNLFNGTRTKRGVEQSKINAKMADENHSLAKRELKKDLAQALRRMATLNKSEEISRLILNASEQDLLLAQEQYKIGSLSILDVLRITASFEDAKSNLIRTQYNLKIAEAGLIQLMGKQ